MMCRTYFPTRRYPVSGIRCRRLPPISNPPPTLPFPFFVQNFRRLHCCTSHSALRSLLSALWSMINIQCIPDNGSQITEEADKYQKSETMEDVNYFRMVHPAYMILTPVFFTLMILFGFFFDPTIDGGRKPSKAELGLQFINTYILRLFQKQMYIQIFFAFVVLCHVVQSFMAFRKATQMGCTNTRFKWMLQTLLFGAASLRLLYTKNREIFLRDNNVDHIHTDVHQTIHESPATHQNRFNNNNSNNPNAF